MSELILIYEPDSAAHAQTYGDAVARAAPGTEIVATANRSAALARAAQATVLIAKAQDVSAELLAAMPQLRWIQALTTGTDALLALELPATVIVTSVRGIHGPQMAELAILLMLALSRDFPRMLANQRDRHWERWGQRLLAGKTVVMVGVGAISEALAARCKALGQTVIGITSRESVDHFDELVPRQRLREAVARADFLVLLVPYSPETRHLIDAAALAAMKPTAYLINVARGGVVDEKALIEALRTRRIAGAGLDVFAQEPLAPTSPLWSLDNVIVTPHVGGMSDIYAEQVVPVLEHNVRAYVAGEPTAMLNRVTLEK